MHVVSSRNEEIANENVYLIGVSFPRKGWRRMEGIVVDAKLLNFVVSNVLGGGVAGGGAATSFAGVTATTRARGFR